MTNKNLKTTTAIFAALAVAAAVAWAGSAKDHPLVAGWPLLLFCAALAFLVQWVAFVPAYALQTEKFYDLAGSLTFLALLATAARFGPPRELADKLLLLMCGLWAARLGLFLFLRIHKDGADKRFTAIKPSALRFFMAWTMQGLWVFLTLSPVLMVLASPERHFTTLWTYLGVSLWALGFAMELLADWQKRQFRADPANHGKFIRSGLWAWSRHPNYAGEILLWVGVFIACAPMLHGWQWVGVLSPLFVTLLLTRVSGIPLLEASAQARWGHDPDFQAHVAGTPVLWPRPWLKAPPA
jgi:steroid 5-alpha reductase family enzyme